MDTNLKTPVRVIVGLSGGVDSSVAALLLKEQGYQVEGLFMKNWEEDDTETYCAASRDVEDAQAVCDKLQIPLHRINFAAEYWDRVFASFLQEYQAGRTPNPDILCNKEIKFKAFLDYALHLGADYIATGHYAGKQTQDGQHFLCRATDQNKDQTYFLYTLGQRQLAHTLFPLNAVYKPQVRKLAAQAGFANHAKKDSTGICFIGERKFNAFLQRYLPTQPGLIETAAGKVIGEHQGLMYYTIGQRQGLGIGGLHQAQAEPWYVANKDLARNVLVVVQGHNNPLLLAHGLICSQLNWVAGQPPILPLICTAKTRYRQQDVTCTTIMLSTTHYQVVFQTPQRAVTPGQSVVFYQGPYCLGGGIIESAINNF